jgi:hypothetical protein
VAAVVTAVSRSAAHTVSKARCERVRLLAGLGVEGDAHLGATVQHRSRVAIDPSTCPREHGFDSAPTPSSS